MAWVGHVDIWRAHSSKEQVVVSPGGRFGWITGECMKVVGCDKWCWAGMVDKEIDVERADVGG